MTASQFCLKIGKKKATRGKHKPRKNDGKRKKRESKKKEKRCGCQRNAQDFENYDDD